MAYKDPEKAREYQKEYMKKWRTENSEKVREYKKKWNAENKEKVIEGSRKWYAENKEKVKEYSKKYKEENKELVRENNKKYREENKEQIKERRKKWNAKNREKIKEHKKKYYQENKEKVKEESRKYYEENKEKVKENNKKYKEENRDRYNEWRRERYHTDPVWKLRNLTSTMVGKALKEGKGGESMLPYVDWDSYEELKEHIESQFEDWMTWDNHGKWHPTERRWHIDHIKPQSVLLEGVTSMDDPKFRECWALENLRPLEARENIIKGNKIIDE